MNRYLQYGMATISLILCVVVGSTVLVLNSFSPGPITTPGEEEPFVRLTPPQPNSKVNILILGTDEGLQPGGKRAPTRTDTMMLASFNPETSEVNVLSLPRDSGVAIPGKAEYDRLGHAHAYGGIALIVETVEELMDLSIHYYIRVDHSGFRKLIDAIGGVDYYVETDMFYEDPYQDLVIDLKKGQQRLDGDKAEQYVRWRPGSDIDRIGRQQKFLMAAIKQALRPSNLLKVNELFGIATRSVTTNFEGSDFVKYRNYLDGFADTLVRTHVLDGDHKVVNGSWYWELDRSSMDDILFAYFWDSLQGNPQEVSVRIIDASGGKASDLADKMIRRGFNVVVVEEAEEEAEKTTITAHNNSDHAALMVYRFVRQGELFSERQERDVDVTLLIGKDIVR